MSMTGREDPRWRGRTSVTIESYFQTVDSSGKSSTDRRRSTGISHYFPKLDIRDMQKDADLTFLHRNFDQDRWAYLQRVSVYDLEAGVQAIEAGDASMEPITVKGRQTDSDGYTRNDWTNENEGYILPGRHCAGDGLEA